MVQKKHKKIKNYVSKRNQFQYNVTVLMMYSNDFVWTQYTVGLISDAGWSATSKVYATQLSS